MLSDSQRARYDRHLRLEEFGAPGQERLLESSVIVVGAGGLGSPALLYLAAAGVGRIGIVDHDVVDRSNLQRQIVHREADVGVSKAKSAARAVRDLNPDVEVHAFDRPFGEENARVLLREYDLVLDGADNFPTRYLINDAAFFEGKPVVHASIHRFEGQVTTFARDRGPCYRCLFPAPPPAGSVPSCAEAGVLGMLPGMIGIAQATEAVKLLAGIGENLIGRLLHYDALATRWNEFRLERVPACPLCGDDPEITEVASIDLICATDFGEGIRRLSASEYAHLRGGDEAHLLLDVREPSEVAAGSIAGHRNIPLGDLPERLAELSDWRERLIVCQCRRGGRSLEAAELLRRAGFRHVAILDGGYLAWRQAVVRD
jgi:molybdopterin/thiamine biosynthesis adenylyltransferase/rhodanese-related sulfurtransferase